MASEKKAKIYTKAFGLIYKLFSVKLRKDGSIYVYFPQKKNYTLKSYVRLPKRAKKLHLPDNIMDKKIRPYVSYHPGKGTMHINDENGKPFLNDEPSYAIDAIIGSDNFFPIMTIMIPAYILHFDKEETPDKYNYVFDTQTRISQATTFDILVHKKDGDGRVDPKYYNLATDQILRFEHNVSTSLTYSLGIKHVPSNTGTEPKDIILIVQANQNPYALRFEPINQ